MTGNGSLLCLDAGHIADGAIIVDGTRFTAGINQHAGNIQFGIELIGSPASVNVSHIGSNAAEMLSRVLLDLKEMVHGWNSDRQDPWTMYPSPNQFVIQDLHSKSNHMCVPDRASAVSYMTFTPPRTLAKVRSQIIERAQSLLDSYEWAADPVYDWSRLATEPCYSNSLDLETTISSQAGAILGDKPAFHPSTETSGDLRHFCAYGIPCVLYGPGRGYNPHRVDEHYYIDDIAIMVKTLYEITEDWCSQSK
jgi:acetylornithine deacetylase/succinyl-diaminopimelate desuccinylase-like protein